MCVIILNKNAKGKVVRMYQTILVTKATASANVSKEELDLKDPDDLIVLSKHELEKVSGYPHESS